MENPIVYFFNLINGLWNSIVWYNVSIITSNGELDMNKNIIYLILTIIGGLMLMGTTLFTIINWTQMPDQIPLHFDFSGNVTNYGGKAAIIPILAIAWVIFVLMTVIVKFPKTWNIPVAITKENFERVYGITRGMMEVVKFEAVLLMIVTIIAAVKGIDFPVAIMTILIIVISLTVVIGMYLLFKNK